MKPISHLFILAFWLFGFSAFVFAQPQQSEHFRITKSVLDAGGGSSTSANFHLVSAFGQPSPLGLQSSTHFVLSGGFLSPTFSVSPLSPIQALVIQPMLPNVVLHWPPSLGAVSYKVYRSSDPRFTPGPANLVGTVADTSYTDAGITSLRNYYIVTANSGGAGASITVRTSPEPDAAKDTDRAVPNTRKVGPDPVRK